MSTLDLFPRVDAPDTGGDRRPPPPSDEPAAPPFRATSLKMALRDLRANPRASWLLVALIVLPVMLATAVGLGSTALPQGGSADRMFGQADYWRDVSLTNVRLDQQRSSDPDDPTVEPLETANLDELDEIGVINRLADPGRPSTVVEAGLRAFAERGARRVAAAVNVNGGEVAAADLDDQLTAGLWRVLDGRGAEQSGEAAITSAMAKRLDVGVGDPVDIGGRPFDVVGVVERTTSRAREAAVVGLDDVDEALGAAAPAGIEQGYSHVVSFYASDDDGFEPGRTVEGEWADDSSSWGGSDRAGWQQFDDTTVFTTPAGIAASTAMLTLAGAGLIAAAVWQTRVRRRLRLLGLLLVNGATNRQVRRSVTSEALGVGLVGAAIGTALGIALALVTAPAVLRLMDEAPLPIRPSASTMLLPAVLGVAGSLLAAWWPAHRATKVTPQQALAGRVPSRAVRRRTLLVVATALFASVWTLVWFRSVTRLHPDLVLLISAAVVLVAFAAGAVLFIPWVHLVGERLAFLDSVSRIALRDAARQQGRTGAAIAVVASVLLAPVAWGVAHSRNADSLEQLMAGRTVVEAVEPTEPGRATLRQATSTVLAYPPAVTVADAPDALDRAADVMRDRGIEEVLELSITTPPVDRLGPTSAIDRPAVVADEQLRAVLERDEVAALDAGEVLVPWWVCESQLNWRDDDALGGDLEGLAALEAVLRERPELRALLDGLHCTDDSSDLGLLVLPQAATDGSSGRALLGLDGRSVGDLWSTLQDVGVQSDIRDSATVEVAFEPLTSLFAVQGIAGAFALLIIALTLMLTATETDRDLDVLNAIGAEPGLRPRVLARQAWLITSLGAGLAIFLVAIAGVAGVLGNVDLGWIALATMVAVAVVLPLVVATAVRLFARRGRATPTVRLT